MPPSAWWPNAFCRSGYLAMYLAPSHEYAPLAAAMAALSALTAAASGRLAQRPPTPPHVAVALRFVLKYAVPPPPRSQKHPDGRSLSFDVTVLT